MLNAMNMKTIRQFRYRNMCTKTLKHTGHTHTHKHTHTHTHTHTNTHTHTHTHTHSSRQKEQTRISSLTQHELKAILTRCRLKNRKRTALWTAGSCEAYRVPLTDLGRNKTPRSEHAVKTHIAAKPQSHYI